MSYVTVNDLPVMSARITMPRWGVWHADLVLPDTDAVSKRLAINVADGSLKLTGTIMRSGATTSGGTLIRVIGGAGGLSTLAQTAHYRQAPIETPLRRLLVHAGETLSSSSSRIVLSHMLSHWTVMAQGTGLCVGLLVAAHEGAIWRVLPDGTCWVGFEDWADSKMEFDVLGEDPALGTARIFAERPTILPGQRLSGRQVSMVQHQLTADSLRTELWYED